MDKLNNQGIFLQDIYLLDYYGFKVFFQVCKTSENAVCLIELAVKKYKNGVMLTKKIHATKTPFVIKTNNTIRKSDYWVYPVQLENEYWLPIEVKLCSSLYFKAIQLGVSYPSVGVCYAVPIKEHLNLYWEQEIRNVEDEEEIGLA